LATLEVSLDIPEEDRGVSSNEFTYYMRLSSGVIVTKPEDSPDSGYEMEVEEEIIDD